MVVENFSFNEDGVNLVVIIYDFDIGLVYYNLDGLVVVGNEILIVWVDNIVFDSNNLL